MIARDPELAGDRGVAAGIPAGLPDQATLVAKTLSTGECLQLLAVPVAADADPAGGAEPCLLANAGPLVCGWVTAGRDGAPPPITIPLYGSFVAWAAGRAAVVGPAERLAELARAVSEFADHEAALRDAEQRATALVAEVEGDLEGHLGFDDRAAERRAAREARHREAVAVARTLALLAPAVRAPPLHPPTLASQLAERLRDRSRLADRHELAVDRAELAERVAEGASQRALDADIARRQMGLEWAIIVLLVVQTAILVVDLLARQGAP
jgi:hypothetical protein